MIPEARLQEIESLAEQMPRTVMPELVAEVRRLNHALETERIAKERWMHRWQTAVSARAALTEESEVDHE